MPDNNASRPRPLRRLVLAGLFTLAAGLAQAQSGTTVRILVGFPPGGGTDAIARTLAEKLKDQLGVPSWWTTAQARAARSRRRR